MFVSIFLLAALSCPKPQILISKDGWNKQDDIQLKISQRRCREIYPEAPCLILFHKVYNLTYRVTCGQKR